MSSMPPNLSSSLETPYGTVDEDKSYSSSSASDFVNKNNSPSDGTCDQEISNSSRHYVNESQGSKSRKVVFAQQESKQVRTLRFIVGSVLFIVTIMLSVGVYLYSHNYERNEFESSFSDKADKVVSSFQNNVAQRLQTMNTFSITTISHTHAMNETWPFVEVPNMEIQGSNMRKIAQIASMVLGMVVSEENREAWINFTLSHEDWVSESLAVQQKIRREKNGITNEAIVDKEATMAHFTPAIVGPSGVIPTGSGPYMPSWQQSPAVNDTKWVNYDLLHGENASTYLAGPAVTMATHQATVGEFLNYGEGSVLWDFVMSSFFQHVDPPPYMGDVFSYWVYPIMDDLDDDTQPPKHVASFVVFAHWSPALSNVLPADARGIICVLKNTHGQQISYRLDGAKATYLGAEDVHDPTYDDMMVSTTIDTFIESSILGQGYDGIPLNTDYCNYKLFIYPSNDFHDDYITNKPLIYSLAVAFCFCFTTIIFIIYDSLVERRHNVIQKTAVQTSAIVTALFPENVRDRLLQDEEENAKDRKQQGFGNGTTGQRLKNFVDSDCDPNNNQISNSSALSSFLPSGAMHKTKPIADLFPHATVFFADISGFTAWSSVRDPTEVFTLLESVYGAFDSIATRRGVFKVETIGDTYLAVTGVPQPQEHHAVIMARFARDCMVTFDRLVRGLEISLGPGTSNLAIRIGIHSGPVTAGVLRGDKSRFQLFGDTVNTASRMESTGERKQIQISTATADLLTANGKGHWFVAREKLVAAKGKGMVQTYWLHLHSHSAFKGGSVSGDGTDTPSASVVDSDEGHDEEHASQGFDKNHQERAMGELKRDVETQALVEWNTQLLSGHLREVVNRRRAISGTTSNKALKNESARSFEKLEREIGKQTTPLEEITQVIMLPPFNSKVAKKEDLSDVPLDDEVVVQLRQYISRLASLYRNNPFHNFMHASHVAKSVSKLLSRVVAPDDSRIHEESQAHKRKEKIHDHTYGIASSPLTHFSIVLSALIHDVDHRGIPNGQLIVECPALGARYGNRSVAEQNSVDVAWELLMDPSFELLRRTIYTTQEDLRHFRQLIVNTVVATDIFDKELTKQRTERWTNAFEQQQQQQGNSVAFGHNDVKASIVIEHLIQASDVIHTMQHWLIYQKWNAQLFREMHVAFQAGQAAKDPAEGWYGGELWFFDNYVIPLARRLKDCGVFGVSSEECLNYALENRSEWEMRGKEIVAELVHSMSSSIEEE